MESGIAGRRLPAVSPCAVAARAKQRIYVNPPIHTSLMRPVDGSLLQVEAINASMAAFVPRRRAQIVSLRAVTNRAKAIGKSSFSNRQKEPESPRNIPTHTIASQSGYQILLSNRETSNRQSAVCRRSCIQVSVEEIGSSLSPATNRTKAAQTSATCPGSRDRIRKEPRHQDGDCCAFRYYQRGASEAPQWT